MNHAIIKASTEPNMATIQNLSDNGLYLNNTFISKLDSVTGTPTEPVNLKSGDIISIVGKNYL